MSDKLFKPRLEQPKKGSKYYDSKNNPFVSAGYGMFQNGGNCTCYAWGRWYELLGKKPKLCLNNAGDWYNYKDGYKRGKTPKLGAVVCWSGGDGAGHVAIVEEIYSDGDIKTSESGWQSYLFKTKRYNKGYKISGYKFQGFIYPPINFVKELPKEEPIEIKEEPKQEEPTITPIEPKVEEYKLKKEITKDGYYKIKLYNGETLIIK